MRASSGAADWEAGALYWKRETGYINMVNQPESGKHEVVSLDANKGISSHNPMAGHAVGPDIHPYSIKLLYVIAF